MLLMRATGRAVPARPMTSTEAIDTSSMTRDELYELAKDMELEGRSQLTKDELAQAISDQLGAPH
jgi:hypothetical protein